MIHRKTWIGLSIGVSGLALMSVSTVAEAQQAAETGLGDIVVVANRRAENLQSVPIAITALGSETLKTGGITSTDSLAVAVPGLNTGRQVANSSFFLRGVGAQAGSLGTEAPIAVYVDDVYIVGPSSTLFEFNNIDHIEVLKGPQGTLFGRNATGGVIHLLTRDPEPDTRFDMMVGYANYDTRTADLYFSTPVSDTLRANFSFHGSDQNDGWGKNINNGEDVYTGWDWGVRGKIVWEPTDTTYIRLSGDYSVQWSQVGMAAHPQPGTFIQGCVPATAACRIGYIGFYNTADLHAATYNGGTVLTPATNITDFWRSTQRGVSLKINQDVGFANLVSISSWRRGQNNFYLDQDGGPVVTSDSDIHQFDENYSQELQLQSGDQSKISWIVGLYYLHDTAKYNPYSNKGSSRVSNTLNYFGTQKTESVAAFGQATVPVFENTNITLGIRYTEDKRSVAASFQSLNPAGVVVSSGNVVAGPGVPLKKKWSKATYRLAVDHQFTDDLMVYASFNRGFKSGVYNLLVPPSGAAPTTSAFSAPAAPEVLDAYEAGFKSEWLDRRLRFNASAFWYDYTNLQVTSIATGITRTINAGKARIKGIEMDLTALPVDNLTLTAAVSIQDGKYKKFPGAPHNVPQGTPGTPLTAGSPNICANLPFLPNSTGGMVSGVAPGNSGCDLAGNETIRTPPLTISLSGSYTLPTSVGDFNLGATYTYTDRYYWEFDNSVKSPSSNVLNANLTWTSVDKHFDVTLWGKNILGEKMYSYANNTTLGMNFAPAAPFTFGVRFGLHWGGQDAE